MLYIDVENMAQQSLDLDTAKFEVCPFLYFNSFLACRYTCLHPCIYTLIIIEINEHICTRAYCSTSIVRNAGVTGVETA